MTNSCGSLVDSLRSLEDGRCQAAVAYRLTRSKFHEMNLEEHVKFAQRGSSGPELGSVGALGILTSRAPRDGKARRFVVFFPPLAR